MDPRIKRILAKAGKHGRQRFTQVQDYGDRIEKLCKVHGLPPPVREHRFDTRGWDPPRYDKRGNLKLRKWRFDCAWPGKKVAVECHGGTKANYARGRHTRREGINADSEKATAAQLQGWKVFVFTADQLPEAVLGTKADRIVAILREALSLPEKGQQ